MKNKKKGFSLIEVVMALAVISIGVLPILSMYPSALKMTTKATTNEEWSRVTMSILDYVKAKGYDSLKSEFFSSGSAIFEENYEFEPDAPGSKRYKSKNNKFEDDFFGGTNLFFINTKGMKLDDYKFSIYMEDLQPTTTSGGSVEVYGNYDLENNKIVTVSSTSSSIVFGIIKIRETNNFDDERTRDMKFIITPIENWRD